MVDICLLGSGGMYPLLNRHLTSMILKYNGKNILIDCGEGTQMCLRESKFKFKNIDIICFTHFHADHIAGLPGLLLTINNSQKTTPLVIIGPKGIKDIVKGLSVIVHGLLYDIQFIEIESSKESFLFDDIQINTIEVEHTINCYGYSINIKRNPKFDIDKAIKNNIPQKFWSKLQKGEEVKYQEFLYTPSMVLCKERKGLKISYFTDCRPNQDLIDFVSNSDLLIAEGMYGDDEKLEQAKKHMHMIFSESATIAKKSNSKELWLTHFSPAMKNPNDYIEFATNIFKNSKIGYDLLFKNLNFEE